MEGGAKLLNTILETGICDEVHVEVARDMVVGSGVAAPKYRFASQPKLVDGHCVYIEKCR